MEKYRDEVISQLRGCLLSVKGKCDLRQISRDFKMLIGSDIPYSKLGYRSLEEFVLSIPSLTTTQYNGQLYVDAKPTSKSLHIVNMVNKQKTAVKKSFSRPSFARRGTGRPYTNSYSSPRWTPNYVKKPYQSSTRPAAVSHNQFVNILSTHQRKHFQVASRLVVKPEHESQFLVDKNRTDPRRPDYNSQSSYDSSRNKESQASMEKSINDSFEKHRRSSDVQPLYDKSRKVEPDKNKNNVTTKPEEPRAIIEKIRNDTLKSKVESDNILSKVKSRLNKTMSDIQDKPSNGSHLNDLSTNFDHKMNIGKENIGEKLNLSDVISLQEESSHVPLKNKLQTNTFAQVTPMKVTPPQVVPAKAVTFEDAQNTNGKQYSPSHDYLMDLQNFAAIQGLEEPCIKVMCRKTRKTTMYDCSIKVGPHSFSSYPADFFDEELVKQHVAKKALDDLRLKCKRKQSLLLSNDEDVRERIPPIVKSHVNGVWKWQLEADYTEKFKEQLPNNWLEIIDRIPTIEIQSCLENYVLRYCKPGEKGTTNMTPLAANVSVPSNTVTFIDDQMLTAEVTCVVSAGEIWCRQTETPETEQFTELCINMDEYYNRYHQREKTNTIEMGGYYVAINDGAWCRVRVYEINKDDISCFCIDYGDEWIISRKALYQLKRNFATLEAQAFVCRLIGVEELYELVMNSEYLFSLIGKTVQIQHIVIASDNDSDGSSPSDPVFPAVLFDCEANVVVNEHIIYTTDLEYIKPSLKENLPANVHLMHAEKDGFVYVTVHSNGYDLVMKILKDIENDIDKKKIVPTKEEITEENSVDRLYLIKNKRDSTWYRAKVNGWRPDGRCQLLLVDVGKTIAVIVNDHIIYPLDRLGDVAHKLSSQAVKVRMEFKGDIPTNFVEQVVKLMPTDQSVMLKVVRLGNDDIPVVEFFKRSETDDVLFSVNQALVMTEEFKAPLNNELLSTQIPQNKIQKLILLNQFEAPKRDNVPSSGSLPCPNFPEVGEFLDVTVPCAVNPFNFMVQPYNSREALCSLMSALQETYKDCTISSLKVEEVLPGQIYASKYEDGNWYRTSVIKVIHAGSISVFNCDFGNYANVTVKQLFPLDSQFTKLAYQAIKARMAGIEPKNLKWSVDDCNAFRKLVCSKPFVSVVISKDIDDLYKYDTVLSLKLIDTSTDNDVHVDQILIDRGIAKKKV